MCILSKHKCIHFHSGSVAIQFFCLTTSTFDVHHHSYQYRMKIVCSLHSVCTNAQDKLNVLHLAACGGHVEIEKYLRILCCEIVHCF